jgi:hypothetical protein
MTSQHRRRGSSAMRALYTACSAAALIAGLAVAAPSASAQQTTPGDANCPIVAGVATCTGNLTDGVSYQIGDPDNGAGTLIVENPIGPIAPNGIYGVGIDRGDRDMTVIVRDGVVINTVDDQGVVEPAQGIIAIVRNGFDLTLDSGATINADGVTQAIAGLEGVVFGGSAELDITNRGNITVATGNHFSVGIAANNNSSTGGVTVNNSGTLNASSTAVGERDSIVSGILVSSAAGATVDVTNSGNINVTTAPGSFDTNFQGEATGIIVNALADTSATTITNSGTLTGTGPNAGGIVGFTRNNNASAPSTVVINNTGAINLNSNDSYGILIQSAGANANLTVDNDAEIAMINGLNSNGIMALGQSAAGTFSLDNSATISGSGTDYMRGVGISTSGAPANGTYTFDIENSGNITFDTPYAHGLTMFSSLGDNVTATLNNTGNIDLSNTTTDFSAGIRAVLNGAAGGETATGTQTLTVTNSGDITMGAGNAMLLSGTTVNLTNSGDLAAAGAIPTVDITANTGTANFNNASVTATGANSFAFRQAGSGAYTVNVGAGSILSATGAGGTGIGMAAEGGTTINVDGTVSGTLAAIRANANVNGNDRINISGTGVVTGDVNTGGGDDVIVVGNAGTPLTINGSIVGDVDMGAGNDTLTLNGTSQVNGAISMGDGNDVVNMATFSNINQVMQLGAGDDILNTPGLLGFTRADGGAGNDIIRMTYGAGEAGGGSVNNFTAAGFEIAQQNGQGTVTWTGTSAIALRYELNGGTLNHNANMANMDFVTASGTQLNLNGAMRSLASSGRVTHTSAAPSTINMTGPVVFNSGSIYDVRIAPGGVSDRINTTGTATINGGTVNALVGAGTYVAGDAFTILNAQGGVTGMFSGLTQVSTAFLDISLVYLPNAVQIQLAPNRVDFTDFDLTFNQSQSSIPIDMFDQSAGTDTRTVSSEFLFLNTDQVAPALDNVSGELHASVLAAGMRSARSLMAAADARVNTKPGLSFWGGVAYNDNSIDGDGNASSVSSTGYTAMAGGDWTFGEAWAGALLGLTQSETEIFSGADSADNDAWTVGGYAGIGGNGAGLSARANAAWSTGEVDASRTIAFGGLNRVASSTYDLDTISASAEVRYGFFEQSGGFHWGPIAAVDYANVERGSFTETGADSLNLAGDDDAVSRFNYGAGGFVNWSGPGMTLDASLLWDQRDGDYTQTALRMTGLPGVTYSVRSPDTDSSGLRLSARGEFEVGDGWSLGAGYQGGFGGGEDSHAALVTLTLR